MSSTSDIRTAIAAATTPEPPALEQARMIVVNKLGEWESLALDELVESVCEAYEAPSGEPLRVTDVDPADLDTDSPALRNLRYARAARQAVIDLVRDGVVVAVASTPVDWEKTPSVVEGEEGDVVKETTDAAADSAGADELILSAGPQPEGRRFTLV